MLDLWTISNWLRKLFCCMGIQYITNTKQPRPAPKEEELLHLRLVCWWKAQAEDLQDRKNPKMQYDDACSGKTWIAWNTLPVHPSDSTGWKAMECGLGSITFAYHAISMNSSHVGSNGNQLNKLVHTITVKVRNKKVKRCNSVTNSLTIFEKRQKRMQCVCCSNKWKFR